MPKLVNKEKKAPNYTAEQTAEIVSLYEAGREAGKSNKVILAEIAEVTKRKPRSIVSKLSREGKYEVDEKAEPKAKDEGPSKKDLLNMLEARGFNVEGFEGATKAALTRILDMLPEADADEAPLAEAA